MKPVTRHSLELGKMTHSGTTFDWIRYLIDEFVHYVLDIYLPKQCQVIALHSLTHFVVQLVSIRG